MKTSRYHFLVDDPKHLVKARRIAFFAAVSVLGIGSPLWAQNWTGAAGNDWNTAANWSGGSLPNGQTIYIETTTPSIATITANSNFTPVDIRVGTENSGNTGRVDLLSGSLSTGNGNWMFVGTEGANGTFNLANTSITGGALTGYGLGSGSLTVGGPSTSSGRLWIGADSGGMGTFNMNTSGFLTTQQSDLGLIVATNGGNGVFNLDNGTVNINNGGQSWFGDNNIGSGGTLNMSGGVFNASGNMLFGHNTSTGVLNMSGGVLNLAAGASLILGAPDQWWLADTGVGVMNLSGGTVNAAGGAYFGHENGNGTLNMSGGVLNVPGNLEFGVPDQYWVVQGGTGVMNLSGGTLNASYVNFANSTAGSHLGVGSGTIAAGAVLNSQTWVEVGFGGNGGGGAAGNLTVNGALNVNTAGGGGLNVGTWDTVPGVVTINDGAKVKIETTAASVLATKTTPGPTSSTRMAASWHSTATPVRPSAAPAA